MERSDHYAAQLFACKLPVDLLTRLRLEAARRNQTIRAVVAQALDEHLPRKIDFIVNRRSRKREGHAMTV